MNLCYSLYLINCLLCIKLRRLHTPDTWKQEQSEEWVKEEPAKPSRKEITAKEVNLVVWNIYYSSAVICFLARAEETNSESVLQQVKKFTKENR